VTPWRKAGGQRTTRGYQAMLEYTIKLAVEEWMQPDDRLKVECTTTT
jgi:hypothetical protein